MISPVTQLVSQHANPGNSAFTSVPFSLTAASKSNWTSSVGAGDWQGVASDRARESPPRGSASVLPQAPGFPATSVDVSIGVCLY